MAQSRLFQPAVPTQDTRRERSRNLRTILVLVGIFVAMFAGSIMYIVWYPTAS